MGLRKELSALDDKIGVLSKNLQSAGDIVADVVKITDDEFHKLVHFVHSKYGIDLSKKKLLIEGRLSYTIRQKGLNDFSEYFKIIENDTTGTEIVTLLNKITTNHSYFAREQEHFEFLYKFALPSLEKSKRNNDIRTWSAGCSAGQEAYNIAMVFDDYFGNRKQNWDTTILATDISRNVLGKARNGIYSSAMLKDVSPDYKRKYFRELPNGEFQVIERIRNEVVFKVLNLMEKFTFKQPFDIIFCRNVMIYFDTPTTDKLINKFYEMTAVGGFFCIGHSEVIDKTRTKFKFIRPAVYQRVE